MNRLIFRITNEDEDTKTYWVTRKTLAGWMESLAADPDWEDSELLGFLNTIQTNGYCSDDNEDREY